MENDFDEPGLPSSVASTEVPDESAQVDYFGVDETHIHYLPDGKSYIEHKTMAEGERKKYLDATNRDVALNRQSGDMKIKIAAGSDRHELLRTVIIGWNLVRKNSKTDALEPVPFVKGSPGSTFEQWLTMAPPKVIDGIEKDIRKHNPWLLGDMSVEDIDKQITELYEQREILVKEEAGK